MSKETQALKNKAREYVALLKNKTTQELVALKSRLSGSLKGERAKESPDNRLIHDYNIQLSLLGRELKCRAPIHEQGDNFMAVEAETIGNVKPKSFEEILHGKSLDELKKMLAEAEKDLADFKVKLSGSRMTADAVNINKAKLEALANRVEAIKAEIATRSEQASNEAKKDASSMGKFFEDYGDYMKAGLVGGVIVGAIGHSFGKNVWGFGLIGAGVGSGIVWLVKTSKQPKVVHTP